MEAFLIYQLKVALLAAVLFLLYRLLLSKQTFHGFNRAMLLFICVLSLVLPFCHVQGGDTVSREIFHWTAFLVIWYSAILV